MDAPADRPTARELAAQTHAAEGAWVCPRCGCQDWKVESSYMAIGRRQRRRICRHCKQEILRTSEVVVPEGFQVRVVPKDDEDTAA
jgi:transcriptional regulator NrdR family protein